MLTIILERLLTQPNIRTCRINGRFKHTYTKIRDLSKTVAGDEIEVKVILYALNINIYFINNYNGVN